MMAYTAFDKTVPAGSQTGPQFATSANANDVALWYALAQGGSVPGWTLILDQGTYEKPTYYIFYNGTRYVRATNTWTGANLTRQVWQVSEDSGGTWSPICTQDLTYDDYGNVTQSTGAAGMIDLFKGMLSRVITAVANLTAHTAASVASGAHSAGTLAAQNYNAVSVTGGSINNATIGVTTPVEGRFMRALEKVASVSATANQAVTIDWSYGGTYLSNPASGSNTLSFQNIASAGAVVVQTHALYIANFNNVTWPVTGVVAWGAGGKPSIAGAVLVQLATFNGGSTIHAIVAWRAV